MTNINQALLNVKSNRLRISGKVGFAFFYYQVCITLLKKSLFHVWMYFCNIAWLHWLIIAWKFKSKESHVRIPKTDLSISLSVDSGQQGVEDDDGLVEVPDEDSLEICLRTRGRVRLAPPAATSTPTTSWSQVTQRLAGNVGQTQTDRQIHI